MKKSAFEENGGKHLKGTPTLSCFIVWSDSRAGRNKADDHFRP